MNKRNFWIPCVTTIVLACASTAFAQQSYKITDLGVNKSSDNFNMVIGSSTIFKAGQRTWMGF